jgi:hypothetical protein
VPGVVQSVVTGNTREIATEKLSAFGLDAHLDLEVGGCGDERPSAASWCGGPATVPSARTGLDVPWEPASVRPSRPC